MTLKSTGRSSKKQIKNTSTEDTTPKISAEKLNSLEDIGQKDQYECDLELFFKIVRFGVIFDYEQCTEYHGELKSLQAHGTGFLRVQNSFKALSTINSFANRH